MKSIRNKLFFQIGGLILLLLSIIAIANTFFLEGYYTREKKQELITYYNTINELPSEDYQDYIKEFANMESGSNVDILIYNAEKGMLYTSRSYLGDNNNIKHLPFPQHEGPPMIPMMPNKEEIVNDQIKFLWSEDGFTGMQNIILTGLLNNGNSIDLRISVSSISSSIQIANKFLIYIGIILLFVAMISAFLLSQSFTKPILAMNLVTKRLKNLQFDQPCEVHSNNELGQLAISINEMSEELKVNIEVLNEKNAQLEQEIIEKNRMDEKRKELLNNVSHELKTPLALMQGYAEGLKLGVVSEKEKTDFYCEVIMDETKKMNKLVQNLLSINQMEFGDDILYKASVEINDFINYIVKKYEPSFIEHKIQASFAKILPLEVNIDRFRAEQVLTNYINNAICYVDDRKIIRIDLEDREDHVRIKVYNTGKGIDEREQDKIWDSFYKIDQARSRDLGGHGLGLSIVKAIQSSDHNKYGVENLEDGVSFWFEVDKNN